ARTEAAAVFTAFEPALFAAVAVPHADQLNGDPGGEHGADQRRAAASLVPLHALAGPQIRETEVVPGVVQWPFEVQEVQHHASRSLSFFSSLAQPRRRPRLVSHGQLRRANRKRNRFIPRRMVRGGWRLGFMGHPFREGGGNRGAWRNL